MGFVFAFGFLLVFGSLVGLGVAFLIGVWSYSRYTPFLVSVDQLSGSQLDDAA